MSTGWGVVALAAGAGAAVGWRLGRALMTLGYRIDSDAARRTGPPLPLWTVPVTVAVLWAASTAVLASVDGWALLPAYLYLAVAAVGLAWVDLDVHRLPDGIIAPSYPLLGLLLVAASAATGHWTALVGALVGSVIAVGGYGLLALTSAGGPGRGDVKLAGLLGAVLGWSSPYLLVPATLAAFLVTGAAALVLVATGRATLRSPIAFGPGMLAGVFVTLWTLTPVVFHPAGG